eukprot:COSAG01_NODE_7918_length_2993_cov_26.468556_5_plen_62_part_01
MQGGERAPPLSRSLERGVVFNIFMYVRVARGGKVWVVTLAGGGAAAAFVWCARAARRTTPPC